MKIHQLEGYIQDIYLVEYPEGLLLLDGCCKADVTTVTRFISEELNRPLSDLKLVVVTHMHPDHAGAAHPLREITGCKIAAANVEGHWYEGIDGKLMYLTDVALANWVAGKLKKPRQNLWYATHLEADYKLDDGDHLPGFSEWKALHTQGHTDRDLSLLHEASRSIYVADLVVTVKGRYIPPFPVFHPNRYKRSINLLKELSPEFIYLAHGGKVQLTDSDYEYLFEKAPRKPQTPWRVVKAKFKRMWYQKAA